MRLVTYSMSASLDGYVMGPDGSFDWSEPDEGVFRLATEEVRGADVHFLGSRLYRTMQYWDDVDQEPGTPFSTVEFAALWRALPKVVFSRSSLAVGEDARLATRSLADEIADWKQHPGDGDIALGGADLAGQAAALGLIDEYRVRVYPVFVGGGTPYFPAGVDRQDLELLSCRSFPTGVIALRYRVRR